MSSVEDFLKKLEGKVEETSVPEEEFIHHSGPDLSIMVACDLEQDGVNRRLYFWKRDEEFYFQRLDSSGVYRNFKVLVPLKDLPHKIMKEWQDE